MFAVGSNGTSAPAGQDNAEVRGSGGVFCYSQNTGKEESHPGHKAIIKAMFDIFFPLKQKALQIKKLEKLLKEISALSPEEREYVKAAFGRFQANGISKLEAEQVIRGLKFNFKDTLEPGEVEKIKLKILSFFV